MKHCKVDDGPVALGVLPAMDVNWLPAVTRKTITEGHCDYQRYHGILDDNTGQPADVPADVVDDVHEMFSNEVDWERMEDHPLQTTIV